MSPSPHSPPVVARCATARHTASSSTRPTCRAIVDEILASEEPHLVLVDDADAADDPGGCLARLIAARHEQVHVVAAGRSDELRRAYNHWTGAVRKSKVGVLLDPDVTDAELLGAKLPPPGAGVRPSGTRLPGGVGIRPIGPDRTLKEDKKCRRSSTPNLTSTHST